MITDPKYEKWGNEQKLKWRICEAISKGSKASQDSGKPNCRIIMVLIGDEKSAMDDVKEAVKRDIPIILVRGSELSDKIADYILGADKFHNAEIEEMLNKAHIYVLDTGKSEDIAAFAHFFLTVTPY